MVHFASFWRIERQYRCVMVFRYQLLITMPQTQPLVLYSKPRDYPVTSLLLLKKLKLFRFSCFGGRGGGGGGGGGGGS